MSKTISTSNTETKGTKKAPATCRTCLHAMLHRYDNNPILAACSQKPQPDNERFSFEVNVASTPRSCSLYKFDAKEKEVEQRTRRHTA